MEPKTTQKLMEIQSALQGELAIRSAICFQNESGKAEDTYTTFKRLCTFSDTKNLNIQKCV